MANARNKDTAALDRADRDGENEGIGPVEDQELGTLEDPEEKKAPAKKSKAYEEFDDDE